MKLNSLLLSLPLLFSGSSSLTAGDLPLHLLQLPDGMQVSVVAEVPNARQMALAQDGTLFVGTRRDGRVFVLQDKDQNGHYEQRTALAQGLNLPSGVAIRGNDLYVAEVNRIWRYPNLIPYQGQSVEPELYFDQLPDKSAHGWKYLSVGPDQALYFGIGAPCNICRSNDQRFASLVRLGTDKQLSIFAQGVRNSVGLAWHPNSNQLWFTDNGRDWLGDNLPSCELNVVTRPGQHFGYPFVHADNLPDPEFGAQAQGPYQTPAYLLGAHKAPLGLTFYTPATQATARLPGLNQNSLLIAEHGSWNRSQKTGYQVVRVDVNGSEAVSYQPFITGWLQGETAWGRPNDLVVDPRGHLLISDDQAGVIYRIKPLPDQPK
ncbi:PQQ-dependent sugar dehydrogenase [Pontibacter sp. JAM-7]|uniref:PQQ-dependent sugar dehydrogenase n=1 Tax=Pontibacter sp. JAM-7 TaxID=3366581 RepID=UPI003AF77CEB